MISNTDVGGLEQGEMTITPTSKDEYVENCYDLIEDTAIIVNSIDEVVNIKGTGTYEINVSTNPTDATIKAVSDTTGTATVEVADKKVTITGVASGSAIITITVEKDNYASFSRSVLVIVTE